MTLKEKLSKGKTVIGTWCEIPSPEVINILAKSGLDFIIIDMEHGAMDFRMASQMIIAAEVDGCSSLIRVPRNDESDILRALDIGVSGVVVPHIESVEDRNKAIKHLKFPPVGNRSLNPYTRAGSYQSSKDYTKIQNEQTLSILIIEGKNGINQLDKILDNPYVDVIYIGTYDLSLALGIPGDTKNELIVGTLKNIVKKITKKKKIAGCLFHDKEEFIFFKKLGIQFLCYKTDTSVIFDKFNQIVKINH